MKALSYIVMVVALVFLGFTIGRVTTMENQKQGEIRFELKEYTGVGSGVFKHGTIVVVEDGQPKVVGHFIDEAGEFSPGTVEAVRIKQ